MIFSLYNNQKKLQLARLQTEKSWRFSFSSAGLLQPCSVHRTASCWILRHTSTLLSKGL